MVRCFPKMPLSSANALLAIMMLFCFASKIDGSPASKCPASLKASYGFFCDSNEKWRMRKEIFLAQGKNQIQPVVDRRFKLGGPGAGMGIWFQHNYEPNFSCELEKRIGRPGDGGKWVCNPHRISELMHEKKKKCLVLSIGSNNDFSFEEGIRKELPGCEIHTIDYTTTPKNVPEGVRFHNWGLAHKDHGNMKTLATIVKELGIGSKYSLEILKVDIEQNEWDVFVGNPRKSEKGLLARDDFPFVRQLLIELHPVDLNTTRQFFKLAEDKKYVIAHKEPNLCSLRHLQQIHSVDSAPVHSQ